MDIAINPAGIPINIPSILSKIPPCPGKRDPVSLMFAHLLRYEINKSPNWQPIEVMIEMNKILILNLSVKIKNKTEIVKQVKKIDPMAPE
jgi:hypothetical protein